jgi:lipid II:glycine glycyltransferase (peptidoglycan interpeptide bridge formation enzyme)
VRLADEGDREEWNRVAREGVNGTFFHTWEWCEAIRTGQDEQVYRIIYEFNNKIVAIWPCFVRSKERNMISFMNVLWSPYPSTWGYGGPCLLRETEKNCISEMLDFIDKIVKENKKILDFRVSLWEDDFKDFFMDWTKTKRQTSVLDITHKEEYLLKSFDKRLRNSISKAKRSVIEVISIKSKKKMITFYNELWKPLVKRKNILDNPMKYFEKIYDLMADIEMVKIFIAEIDGNMTSAILTGIFRDTMFYMESATSPNYRKENPNSLLLWEAILYAKKRGIRYLDLCGMPEDKENGIFRFKSKFNGEIKQVTEFRKRYRFKIIRKTIKKAKKILERGK